VSAPDLPPSATARAGTNIALVKYWGKRDAALNLPAAGSLSLTLAELGSETRVRFAPDSGAPGGGDRVLLDGEPADARFAGRVSRFLDLVRARAGLALPAEVSTRNSVPTAAGLASSASGFAALALAASRAAGLALAPPALSALARRGSGSAARSVFGGFVEMSAGQRADGEDAVARPLLEPGAWDVRLVVAVTAPGPKAVGSTEAMDRTAATSPYYPAWLASVETDLRDARAALAARDLPALGAVAERSALRMHASALAAVPPVLYFQPGTIAAVRAVMEARAAGLQAYVTIDAGPHVKALCHARDAGAVERLLRAVPGVERTLVATPGPGATLIEETP
jgi:diphosphomevalonate decarboxylase